MTKLKEKHTEFPAVPLSPSTGTAQLSTSATGATSSLQVTLLQRHHLEFVVHLRVCSCLVHFDLLTSKTLYLPSGHRVNKAHSPKHLKFCLLVLSPLEPFQSLAYRPHSFACCKMSCVGMKRWLSMNCSCRGPGISSWHPHGGSQLSTICSSPFQRLQHPVRFLGLCKVRAVWWYHLVLIGSFIVTQMWSPFPVLICSRLFSLGR